MKKDAYYFPHFCNARNDSKIIKLRRVLGIEGYGIYFMLLEILREQTDFKYPIAGIEDLSYEWHTSKEKIATVINDFELFTIIENEFFSAKLVFYLQPYIEKSERARIAARKRWSNINANAYAKALEMHNIEDANVLPEQCESECKESKGEESKVNDINILQVDKSKLFYQKQIELNKDAKFINEYITFFEMLTGKNKAEMPMNELLCLQYQVSYKVFENLLDESKKRDKKLTGILLKASNDDRYSKGKRSLPIIIMTWLETDFK